MPTRQAGVSDSLVFGDLLRRYRFEVGLTQEALAERAGLSARAISDLERGLRNAPRRETVRLLADTLGLNAQARAGLELAARRPRHRSVLEGSEEPLGTAAVRLTKLVGRVAEVEALRGKLRSARAGRGGLVLLSGEPGIGKTRLLEESAIEARQNQMLVLSGRCWESEGAPPFWPWTELLQGLIRNREPPLLRAALAAGAPFVAQLVPEVRELLPDLPPVPALEPREARFRLFDAITTVLQNVARSQPLLLVLDDLHWADKPSLLLLEFMLPSMRVSPTVVLGTYRDTDLKDHAPLAEVLGSLWREPSFEVLPLKGLTVDAVVELLDSSVDRRIGVGRSARELARELWQVTEGNPLFVREELQYLADEDRLPGGSDKGDRSTGLLDLGLPQGVRDVIRLRLSRLSPSTSSLLNVAAVIGREFETTTLQEASGLDDLGVDSALDEAQKAQIVEEPMRSTTGYRFVHALFREALYADLPARRRRRLHHQVAEALERIHISDLDSHVSELAYHYGEAQALRGNEKLAHYSLLAGEQALATKAYEEAVTHFERGLEAKTGQPIDAEQAALVYGLGWAQAATLELPRAREVVANLTRAFDYYAEHGNLERAVAAAVCPVDALPGQRVGAARLAASALALVDPNSHAAGLLLARYARMAAIEEGKYQTAAEACDRALAIARREADIPLEIQALGNGAEGDLNYLRWPEGLAKCLRAIDLAERTDAVGAEVLARLFASLMLWFRGELERATEQASALLMRAEQLRDPRWQVTALWIGGTLARYRGDFANALDMTDRGLAMFPADPRLLWTRASLAHDAGDEAVVRSLIARLLEVVPLTPREPTFAQACTALVLAVVNETAVAQDNLRLAEAASEAILSFPSATEMILRLARASLAVMAVRRGDAAAARRHYPALQAARDTLIYEAIAGDRLLGLLAVVMGEHDTAVRHFESALTFCQNSGCEPELAWTCSDLADLLGARRQPGDDHRATTLRDAALTIARRLGMQPLVGRVLSHR